MGFWPLKFLQAGLCDALKAAKRGSALVFAACITLAAKERDFRAQERCFWAPCSFVPEGEKEKLLASLFAT